MHTNVLFHFFSLTKLFTDEQQTQYKKLRQYWDDETYDDNDDDDDDVDDDSNEPIERVT